MFLKIMIADDEALFREALTKTTPWNELGYEVCCEAENGYEALEKISEYKPDVALVDINMPIMDGLTLAAEIKRRELDVRVIIITGYSEFEYARQALESSVENYLLKPVDDDQLARVLTDLKSKINLKKDQQKKKVTVDRPLIKEMILNNLLQGSRQFENEELSVLKKSFVIDPDGQPFLAIVIELCEKEEYRWNEDERRLWLFAVTNIIREIFSTGYTFECWYDNYNRICVLANISSQDNSHISDISGFCERIRLYVKKHLSLIVTIGISNVHQGFDNMAKSYNEAISALKNRLLVGDGKVIHYSRIPESDTDAVNIYPVDQKRQILMAARLGNTDEVNQIITSVFEEIKSTNSSSDLVMVKCIELVSTCLEFISSTGHGMKGVFGHGFNILQHIQRKRTVEELEQWIKDIFRDSASYISANKAKRYSKTVEDAKKYIYENYSRSELNIDDVAKHVYVRYGHLCSLFKRETGNTLNDFITELRINKAKVLIDEGCHSVSVVSAKVGYADSNYFGKCFKKIFGINPSKYIDNLLSR